MFIIRLELGLYTPRPTRGRRIKDKVMTLRVQYTVCSRDVSIALAPDDARPDLIASWRLRVVDRRLSGKDTALIIAPGILYRLRSKRHCAQSGKIRHSAAPAARDPGGSPVAGTVEMSGVASWSTPESAACVAECVENVTWNGAAHNSVHHMFTCIGWTAWFWCGRKGITYISIQECIFPQLGTAICNS